MIKLQCKKCKFTFEVSEKEFLDYPDAYKECYVSCGGENEVINLEEIVNDELEKKAENYLTKWFNEFGFKDIRLIKEYNININGIKI
jgi:hypothetical protein